MTKFEAAAIGAGPTGLVAALALARMGVEVALVAPGVRPLASEVGSRTDRLREGSDPRPADQRTTALLAPSVKLLENLGVFDPAATADARLPTALGSDPQGLRRKSPPPVDNNPENNRLSSPRVGEAGGRLTPITAVRIADDRGGLVRAPETVFRAAELGLGSFGANIANETLVAALRRAAERVSGLAWVGTGAAKSVAPGASSARLELAEGGTVEASLIVAADGRHSTVRQSVGIACDSWAYPQAAVAARFSHSRPHHGVVNELHRHAGPLTTIPMAGRRCAVVWMEAPREAARLAALGDAAFAAVLEERLQGVLGTVSGAGPRAVFPLTRLVARSMTGPRVALVGEAAHVIPPVGAQGLNLGLRDVAALADCVAAARAAGQDIGGPEALAAYRRARAADVTARSVAVDLLNRSLLADMLPVDVLRGLAAHLVVSLGPLRRLVMQEGMGLAGPLPTLMR